MILFIFKLYSVEHCGFGSVIRANWFGVEQLRVLNFPIFSKDIAVEPGTTSYTNYEPTDEESAGDGAR